MESTWFKKKNQHEPVIAKTSLWTQWPWCDKFFTLKCPWKDTQEKKSNSCILPHSDETFINTNSFKMTRDFCTKPNGHTSFFTFLHVTASVGTFDTFLLEIFSTCGIGSLILSWLVYISVSFSDSLFLPPPLQIVCPAFSPKAVTSF